MSDSLLVLGAEDISSLLEGREHELCDAVGQAYKSHALGDSNLPHSSFLSFPDQPRDRSLVVKSPAMIPLCGKGEKSGETSLVPVDRARNISIVVENFKMCASSIF